MGGRRGCVHVSGTMKTHPWYPFLLSAILASGSGCDDGSNAGKSTDNDASVGPTTTRIFVSDGTTTGEAGKVFVFDAETLEPQGSITVGSGASEIYATPDGSLLWVLSSTDNSVSLIDTGSLSVTRRAVGVKPVHSFITPTHDQIWVGNDGSADVSVIDIASREVLSTVLTGAGHHKMALASGEDGSLSFAYVSNITDGTITPVTAGRAALPNVSGVGIAPHGMDYDPETTHVLNCSGDLDLVTAGSQPGIEVIATRDDPGTAGNEQHTLVDRIPLVPGRCGYLHVHDGYANMTLGSAGLFARMRTTTGVVETFDAGPSPDKFAVVGDRVFVANARAPIVTLVDLTRANANVTIATGNPVDPANVPTSGHRSILGHAGRLYVPNAFDGTVTVIDAATGAVVGTLAGMTTPVNVAIAGPGVGTTYPR